MQALADTGATLTVMPGVLRDRLGVQRLRRVSLVPASGPGGPRAARTSISITSWPAAGGATPRPTLPMPRADSW